MSSDKSLLKEHEYHSSNKHINIKDFFENIPRLTIITAYAKLL